MGEEGVRRSEGIDRVKWLGSGVAALVLAVAAPIAVFAALGSLDDPSGRRFAAVLALAGATLTACTTMIGFLLNRQAEARLEQEGRDERERLRLDAAMRAGALLNADDGSPASPAAIASGLLALTQLDRADLAVALLVDLWDLDHPIETHQAAPPRRSAVSHETAILVVDSALGSDDPRAQLVAAELLCRNSWRLDICQSLHWPSRVDGDWDERFGVKTKVLLVDALARMAYRGQAPPSIDALQSLAVRLYGISDGDPDAHVKGCIGLLLDAILPALRRLKVKSLMQGSVEITISDIARAASYKKAHRDDRVLHSTVTRLRRELADWADGCQEPDCRLGALAAAGNSSATNGQGRYDRQ